jgi:hypothetical protein
MRPASLEGLGLINVGCNLLDGSSYSHFAFFWVLRVDQTWQSGASCTCTSCADNTVINNNNSNYDQSSNGWPAPGVGEVDLLMSDPCWSCTTADGSFCENFYQDWGRIAFQGQSDSILSTTAAVSEGKTYSLKFNIPIDADGSSWTVKVNSTSSNPFSKEFEGTATSRSAGAGGIGIENAVAHTFDIPTGISAVQISFTLQAVTPNTLRVMNHSDCSTFS